MRMAVWGIVSAALFVTSAAGAQDAAVRMLVDRFEAARAGFDPVALAKTLAPDYEEISPVGDVDSREDVLGFYKPEAKSPVPAMTSDDVAVRSFGDTAFVTLRKSFTPPGSPTRSVRVRYVARKSRGAWQLISAQYTPVSPARPK